MLPDAHPQFNKRTGSLIPAGSYIALIEKAEMKQPRDVGKDPYLYLELEIKDATGKSCGKIFDIITESSSTYMRYKLRCFISAIDIHVGQNFELSDLVNLCVGKECEVIIAIDYKSNPPRSQINIFAADMYKRIVDPTAKSTTQNKVNCFEHMNSYFDYDDEEHFDEPYEDFYSEANELYLSLEDFHDSDDYEQFSFLTSNRIGYNNSSMENVKDKAKKYVYVGIRYSTSNKIYYFICDDWTVRVGDIVRVPSIYNEYEDVRVVTRATYTVENAPYPVERSKHILEIVQRGECNKKKEENKLTEVATATPNGPASESFNKIATEEGRYPSTKKAYLPWILICFALVLGFLVMGMYRKHSDITPTPNDNIGQNINRESYTISTGNELGTYYAYSTILSNIVSEYSNISLSSVTSGGAKDNIESVLYGESDIGVATTDALLFNDYSEENNDYSFRVICALYPETILAFNNDSTITNYSDLKGKTIYAGVEGSALRYAVMDIIYATGLTAQDVVFYDVNLDIDSLFAQKDISVIFLYSGMTNELLYLAETTGRDFLPLDAETYENLMGQGDVWFSPAEVPVSNTEAAACLAIDCVLFCAKDFPEEAAYEIVKAIHENSINISHPKGIYAQYPEYLSRVCFPYASGAAKYFQEIGIEVISW